MMKPTVFGAMNKTEAKKFKKEMAELKPGDGVDIGDTKYEYGADLNAEGVPLRDPGTGQTVSIRTFDFKVNPQLKKIPDKQTLFNAHARQILTILWGDGLIPLEEVAPRVIIDVKRRRYQFFIPCKARREVLFMEKPKNLSEELLKSTSATRSNETKRHTQ